MHRFALLLTALLTLAVATAAPGTAATGVSQPGCARTVAAHEARCFAQVRAAQAFSGLKPADIAAAYKLHGSGGTGHTVAIVDAQDDPKAEADLATYRARYGLPACTTANGCFRKVNQRGVHGKYPDADPGWSVEISLDLDAVSAACPQCHLLLVEGDSPDLGDLAAAVDTAVRLGADAVSNSYGASEFTGMATYAKHYVHAGVSVVASSGDDGFGPASFPAALPNVIGVGGTTLTRAPSTARGWSERAWAGAGSGCSAYYAKPSFQHDTHCAKRTVADVSAVADPDTGLAVYDTYGLGADNGWNVVGGTSLSAPLITGMIVRSGHAISTAKSIYNHPGALFDPVGGSTGYCGGDDLCTGTRGYDAPTGAGSPNGLGAL